MNNINIQTNKQIIEESLRYMMIMMMVIINNIIIERECEVLTKQQQPQQQ